jgi:hypothetical protein
MLPTAPGDRRMRVRADHLLPDRRAERLARLWQIGKEKLRRWRFPY